MAGTEKKQRARTVTKAEVVERVRQVTGFGWTESGDHRLWTFKLRKGLEFHDGKPVTGEDVIASLQRWGKRDAMGSGLFQFVQRMDSPAPDTFRIFLGEACGFMLEALGKPSSCKTSLIAIVGDSAGKIIALHAADGALAWEFDAGSGFSASPAVAAGQLVMASDDGTIWCFQQPQADPKRSSGSVLPQSFPALPSDPL